MALPNLIEPNPASWTEESRNRSLSLDIRVKTPNRRYTRFSVTRIGPPQERPRPVTASHSPQTDNSEDKLYVLLLTNLVNNSAMITKGEFRPDDTNVWVTRRTETECVKD